MRVTKFALLCLGLFGGAGLSSGADIILKSLDVLEGEKTFETRFSAADDELIFDTILKGNYCGSCLETLEQSVTCSSTFAITKDSLVDALVSLPTGALLNDQLKILSSSPIDLADETVERCVQYKLGFEDVPVDLFYKGPACRLPYEDYNDLFVSVTLCGKKEPKPPKKPDVTLEVKDCWGNDLASVGDDITFVPKCGNDRGATYGAYLKGSGADVYLAEQGVTWKIYQGEDDPIVLKHYSDDPDNWVNTPKTGHFLLKTSPDQDQPFMADCAGHRTCFLALPCMYSGRGVVTVEAILKDGTVLKKSFSAKNGRFENRKH
ncbi:MAG: hypothetical protein HRU19_02755 [Pseudobacteriovorax sp.]|nr:hypothetical protein [Pseudobacteriovorax sp.]